jgi:hypothetical protein
MNSDMSYEPCDWNPLTNDWALTDDMPHAEAKYCVGTKGYHLCAECLLLPKFKRMKKKILSSWLWRKRED